jgi:hypothetical protein
LAEELDRWEALALKRVLLLVEGQTEEAFVKHVLNPTLSSNGLLLQPTLICTKRVQARRQHRGGTGGSYQHIRRDMQALLRDSNAAAVSTILDFYGLPSDFPGKDSQPEGTCQERVRYLEDCFSQDIQSPRFVPNLLLHEFEALLFSEPEAIAAAFPGGSPLRELRAILKEFPSPEEINERPETTPCARLLKLFPDYGKVRHGAIIAGNIGLQRMRQRCGHFDDWVCRLEQIAMS